MKNKIFYSGLLFVFFIFMQIEASIVGNPSSPNFYTKGLFFKKQIACLRSGYFYDNIYREQFQDKVYSFSPTKNVFKLKSQGGIVTLNIKNALDLYGAIGVSRMNLDDQIDTKEQIIWSAGMKWLFWKINKFNVSLDGKYTKSYQDAEYFIIGKQVFPVVTPDFGFEVKEYQAALGLSYNAGILIPYVGATYLYSTLTPSVQKGVVSLPFPNENLTSGFEANDMVNDKRWGMIVGVGIVSCNMISINIESRMIDQNAVNIIAEIHF